MIYGKSRMTGIRLLLAANHTHLTWRIYGIIIPKVSSTYKYLQFSNANFVGFQDIENASGQSPISDINIEEWLRTGKLKMV